MRIKISQGKFQFYMFSMLGSGSGNGFILPAILPGSGGPGSDSGSMIMDWLSGVKPEYGLQSGSGSGSGEEIQYATGL